MKKSVLIGIIIGCTAVVSTSAFLLTRGSGVKQIEDSMVSELGEEVKLYPADFLSGNEKKISKASVDISKVDVGEVGLYDATITCDRKDFTVKVSVTDTVAPKLTAKKEIICGVGMPITVKQVAEKVEDAAKTVKVSFKDHEVTDENIKFDKKATFGKITCDSSAIIYTEVGEYDNVVTLTDASGNKSEENIHLVICELPVINANDIVAEVSTTIDYLSGVTATDYTGKDITGKVTLKDASSVNVNVAGEYSAVYTVTDDNGITVEKTVKVTVQEKASEEQNISGDNGATSNGSSKKPSKTASNNNSSNSGNDSNGGSISTPSVQPHWVEGPSTTNGVLNASQKATIDGLVASWKNGGYSDEGLETAITEYLEAWGINERVRFMRIAGNDSFVSEPSDATLEATRQSAMIASDIYSYCAVYTNGDFHGEKLIAYTWFVSLGE